MPGTSTDHPDPGEGIPPKWGANAGAAERGPSSVFGLARSGRLRYLAALSLGDLDAAYLPVGRRV